MLTKLSASATLLVAFAFLVPSCATKPPRQAEAPDVLNDKGPDMAAAADTSGDVKAVEGEQSGEEKMRAKCCVQCKDGMSKDRTGAAAPTIPCTDFTDTLDPFCLEHFRGKKTMASECQ